MSERVLHGTPASPGIISGPAHLDAQRPSSSSQVSLRANQVDGERTRLADAITRSREQIEAALSELDKETHPEWGLLLQVQLLMHRDELIVDAALEEIASARVNAESALELVTSRAIEQLRKGPPYLRERAEDVEQVRDRIVRELRGEQRDLAPEPGCIFVARDLDAADAAKLMRAGIGGVVLERGGRTSHMALLAQALGVPAVLGVEGALAHIAAGETVEVDGDRGVVSIGHVTTAASDPAPPVEIIGWATTRCGESVRISLNTELVEQAVSLASAGDAGVGLFRTEYLYLLGDGPPSAAHQRDAYERVARAFHARPVVFRTCDLGADKWPSGEPEPPRLGLRGVRYSLRHPGQFDEQLQALAHASKHGDIRVLFPMVGTLSELREASKRLRAAEQAAGAERLPTGAMVEVPAAALSVSLLKDEVDFLSVGTNDLIQYMFAADRETQGLASKRPEFEPVLIETLMRIRRDAGAVPVTVCGDMAAEPNTLWLLLHLGYREFSVPAARMATVRDVTERFQKQPLGLTDELLQEVDPTRIEAIIEAKRLQGELGS